MRSRGRLQASIDRTSGVSATGMSSSRGLLLLPTGRPRPRFLGSADKGAGPPHLAYRATEEKQRKRKRVTPPERAGYSLASGADPPGSVHELRRLPGRLLGLLLLQVLAIHLGPDLHEHPVQCREALPSGSEPPLYPR